jgi:hypothetical protein
MTNQPETSHFGSPDLAAARPWHWRLEDSSGAEVTVDGVPAQAFTSQGDAESWLGEIWQDLLAGGADAVTLFEADRMVYGPMSLHA